jgi:hypothetical protein
MNSAYVSAHGAHEPATWERHGLIPHMPSSLEA